MWLLLFLLLKQNVKILNTDPFLRQECLQDFFRDFDSVILSDLLWTVIYFSNSVTCYWVFLHSTLRMRVVLCDDTVFHGQLNFYFNLDIISV